MENEEDEELERIKAAKLQKMMRSVAAEKRGTAFSRPVEMTDATFKGMIQNHPLVVVDCWARWCGPWSSGCPYYRGTVARLCWKNIIRET